MKMMNYFALLIVGLLMQSCVTHQSLLSFNEDPKIPTTPQEITNYNPILIQQSDILQIRLSSSNASAILPFSMGGGTEEGQSSSAYEEYLVNSQGVINFPTLGKINVKGLTIEGAQDKIQDLLAPFFEQAPILQVTLSNFQVNVNGEVGSPGSLRVSNERLTILEAVSMSGDFTSFSNRDSILVIREIDGMRNFGYVNFNSAELFDSPYFYLQQNDVVYVPPTKIKVGTIRDPVTKFLPWVTSIVSVVAIVISLAR